MISTSTTAHIETATNRVIAKSYTDLTAAYIKFHTVRAYYQTIKTRCHMRRRAALELWNARNALRAQRQQCELLTDAYYAVKH